MSTVFPLPATARADTAVPSVEIPQLRIPGIFAVWAAAALPMAALAWLVAPALADRFAGDGIVPMFKALLVCLDLGLVWQFVLVAILVGREQRTLRWSTVREALWLRSPRSPRSGRVGGRVWLIVIPLILAFVAAQELVPTFAAPENREFATLVGSDAGKAFLDGAWGWYALDPCADGVHHRWRGAPVSRVPPPAHERRLRTRRLGRERLALHRLPPARALGDAGDAAGHVHPGLPDQALPERLDRDRGAQLPERFLRAPHPRTRRLRSTALSRPVQVLWVTRARRTWHFARKHRSVPYPKQDSESSRV